MKKEVAEYVLKHNKRHNNRLKYDFMPQLLEIIERPAHIGGKVIIFSIFALLIITIIWACLAELDVVVIAPGTANPVEDIHIIQAQATGKIEEILVSEGEYVKKGQIVMKLDGDSIASEIELLQTTKTQLEIQLELYEDIEKGEDVTNYAVSGYEENIQPFVKAIIENEKSYKRELWNLELQKRSAELDLDLAKSRLNQYQELKLTEQVESQKISIQQQENSVKQISTSIEKYRITHSAEVAQKISSVLSKLQETESKLSEYNIAEKSLSITSSINGYVNNLSVKSVGSVVTQAQELATIIPKSTKNEITCYVKNMDIAEIEKGDEVSIKLDAYPYSRYGTVKGKITYISPGSFVDENMGSVYLVKTDIQNNNPDIQITAGLTGSVEIKTGTRSVMEYFLEPIIDGFGNSMKEK